MSFFEILIAFASIVMFLFSLLVLFFRNNDALLRAMFVPSIFLEDIAAENSFRMPEPHNKAMGVSESSQSKHEIHLKRNFSVHFGLMLLVTSFALMYFAIF